MACRADRRAGFTLIEVLAALVITTAFVAVVLPYAGRVATHWWVGETSVEQADGWIQAIARMSDDVAEAVPLGFEAGGAPMLAFRADADAIALVRPMLGRPTGSQALEIVTYTIRPSSAGQALVRLSQSFTPAAFLAGGARGNAAALLDGPFRFRFVTVDQDGTRRQGWQAPDRMPAAVELSAAPTGRRAVSVAPVLMPVVARQPAVTAKAQ